MAIIPKKNKSNSMEDAGVSVDLLFILIASYVVLDSMFSSFIHDSLSMVLMIFVALLGAYLMFPNEHCKGKNGYTRLLNYLRYQIFKIHVWQARHTWKDDDK